MELLSTKENRRSYAMTALPLLRVFLALVITVGIVMLMIQMHLMHVHMPSFSSSIDRYVHQLQYQQQHQQLLPRQNHHYRHDVAATKVASNVTTTIRPKVDHELEPLLNILRSAGYTEDDFDSHLLASLPKWSDIMKTYGPPKIMGLETCELFQNLVKPRLQRLGVAGIFNSGTNLLSSLLKANCRNRNIYWQVPWGKHYPASFRTNHTVKGGKVYPPYNTVMPFVTTRDPYTWMQSECRQNYAAQFDHFKGSCPNIIPYPADIQAHKRYAKMKYIPIFVKYDGELVLRFDSLPHLWNSWYREYINLTFPAVIVRMEDLVFHAEMVIPKLCECAGATFRGTFLHTPEVSNTNHGIDLNDTQSGLLRSIIHYGNITRRREGYPTNQLEAAQTLLDPELLDLFGYPYEEP